MSKLTSLVLVAAAVLGATQAQAYCRGCYSGYSNYGGVYDSYGPSVVVVKNYKETCTTVLIFSRCKPAPPTPILQQLADGRTLVVYPDGHSEIAGTVMPMAQNLQVTNGPQGSSYQNGTVAPNPTAVRQSQTIAPHCINFDCFAY